MKLLRIALVVLALLVNLVVALPSLAGSQADLTGAGGSWEVGQKVIWLYKARADSSDVHRVPAEVVKLGAKRVQIKVRDRHNGFINRWVNRNRLEDSKDLGSHNRDRALLKY